MERQLLSIDELETRYGLKPWTVRTYCSQGKIPFVKIGRRVYFRVRDIETWIDQHAKPSVVDVLGR